MAMTIEEKIIEHNKNHKVQLTVQMVKYVKKTYKKKNFTQMRKYLGLSTDAFRRLTRIAGIDQKSRSETLRKIVERYAPYMTFKEMANKFGYDQSYWSSLARKYGIKNSKEKEERIAENKRKALGNIKRREGYWKEFGEMMRKKWRMEYFRVRSGMPQQTNLTLRQIPRSVYNKVYHQIRHNGYIQDEYDFKTLYYDENTKRSSYEKELTEKYKIKFLPISEKKGQ